MTESDQHKIGEITQYMNQNPSSLLRIDGSIDSRTQDLTARRVSTVRDALIQAGVRADRMQFGSYIDEGRQRDRRVEVLISSN